MTTLDLGPYPDRFGHDRAVELDRADPLAAHRGRYVITDEDLIYLDGNSLGRLPLGAVDVVSNVTEIQWGDRLIRSWNEGWWDLHARLGDKLADLVGARPGEVIVSDSTSVNLFKLAEAAMAAAADGRSQIVTDDLNFPSDVYVLGGVADRHDGTLEVVRSDGRLGPIEGLSSAISDRTALVSLSHTAFKSGYTYDIEEITTLAHAAGAMVLWDLSHSVGVMQIDLERAGVDLAVGCTYKYLNGGPGAPAFLYVRTKHQDHLDNPIAGWWAHEEPFAFDLRFSPAAGMRRFHVGTMPVVSLAAIETGLDDVLDAGLAAIRSKSVELTEYLISLADEVLHPLGFEVASPRDANRRGSHVSLAHELAWPVSQAMISEANVIPDFRTPDNIRLGLAPLYTRFADVHTAVHRIAEVVENGIHLRYLDASATVT